MAAFSIPQTDFSVFPDAGYEGMQADSSLSDIATGHTEVAMASGLGVVKGAAFDTIKLPTVTGEVTNNFTGVALYAASREPVSGSASQFKANEPISVLKKGAVYVVPFAAALVDDGQVFCIHNGANAGKFRGDAGAGGDQGTLVGGAKVRKGAAVGALAIIDIDIP